MGGEAGGGGGTSGVMTVALLCSIMISLAMRSGEIGRASVSKPVVLPFCTSLVSADAVTA